MIRKFLKFFSSLSFTVMLLVSLLIITFFMTLEQVELGIWFAKKKYFESLFVWQNFGPISIPIFPGGLLIGGLLMINLIIAPFFSFKKSIDKLGIWMIHMGLIVLILGSFLIQQMAVESQLVVREGESTRFSQSRDLFELIVVKHNPGNDDQIISFPNKYLVRNNLLNHDTLPFTVKINQYFSNSELRMSPFIEKLVTSGAGRRLNVLPLPPEGALNSVNNPSAIVEILHQDAPIGTWIVSSFIDRIQIFTVKNEEYGLQLRPLRYYHPFILRLDNFTHDVYPGTTIPKNYASDVFVKHDQGDSFSYKIYMNHPLRYAGLTFYQASFGEKDTLTVLQVVKNAVWWFPYISSLIISLGLLVHVALMIRKRLKTL